MLQFCFELTGKKPLIPIHTSIRIFNLRYLEGPNIPVSKSTKQKAYKVRCGNPDDDHNHHHVARFGGRAITERYRALYECTLSPLTNNNQSTKPTPLNPWQPILPESKAWLLNFYAKPDAILRAMFPEVDFKWTSGGANGGVSGRRRERRW